MPGSTARTGRLASALGWSGRGSLRDFVARPERATLTFERATVRLQRQQLGLMGGLRVLHSQPIDVWLGWIGRPRVPPRDRGRGRWPLSTLATVTLSCMGPEVALTWFPVRGYGFRCCWLPDSTWRRTRRRSRTTFRHRRSTTARCSEFSHVFWQEFNCAYRCRDPIRTEHTLMLPDVNRYLPITR